MPIPALRGAYTDAAKENETPDTHAYVHSTSSVARDSRKRNTLSPQLQEKIPSCAQECVQSYLTDQYQSCPGDGLSCLCSQYSSQGYSLGELAFICLQLDCSASETEQQSVYNICAAQTNVVAATYSTLTVPQATTTSSKQPTTTTVAAQATSTSSSSLTSAHKTAASTAVTAAATNTVSTASSTSKSCSTTVVAATACAAAASAPPTKHSAGLTAGQAVGVSVAAFGAMAALIGLIYLLTCVRRRKAQKAAKAEKRDSYDFVDDAPPRFSPFHHGHVEPRVPFGGLAGKNIKLPSQGVKDSWYQVQYPPQVFEQKLAGQNSPATLGVPRSNESMRTMSQLLPEKPSHTPPQPPHRRPPRPPSMRTPMTVFEEDRFSRLPPPEPRRPDPAHLSPQWPLRRPQYASQYTRSPEDVLQPPLSLSIPQQAARKPRIPSPKAFTPPPVPQDELLTADQRTSRSSKAKSAASTGAGSLLSYYASSHAGEPGLSPGPLSSNPLGSPLTPISLEPQRRMKPVPTAITITKPTYPPLAVRQSTGSETSFESTDPDEPTPPDEDIDKQLSPVAEHSPIAKISYPKIPRSSNQNVPRSPRNGGDRRMLPSQRQDRNGSPDPRTPERKTTHTSNLSGSTLAAKRSARQEKKLVIDTSHTRGVRSSPRPKEHVAESSPRRQADPRSKRSHESPLKGYGRVTTPNSRTQTSPASRYFDEGPGRAQEVVLKSPLWEPKLTPRRRGDDLFLEVGLASPIRAGSGMDERVGSPLRRDF